jgi:hypothetical protein
MNQFLTRLDEALGRIKTGVVIGKRGYQANSANVPHPVMIGKTVVSENTVIKGYSSWTITVHGTTKRGTLVTRTMYVSEPDYGYYRVGDAWPGQGI